MLLITDFCFLFVIFIYLAKGFQLTFYTISNLTNHVIYMDLSFLFFILSLILFFTCCLVYFIFTPHNSVLSNYTASQNKYFKKDLRLSVTSIAFNLLYILFYLPVFLMFYLFPNINDIYLQAAIYTGFLNYMANFYVLAVSNSAFRKRFKKLFCKKHHQTSERTSP